MKIQTVLRIGGAFRGAVVVSGQVVAVAINAWQDRNAAAVDAFRLSRAV